MPYPDRNRDIPITGSVGTAAATAVLLLPAPGVGKSYIFRVHMTNGGASGSANYVNSATSGTVHFRAFLAASGGGSGVSPWLVSDPNNQVNFTCGTASTTQYCCVEAHILGSS